MTCKFWIICAKFEFFVFEIIAFCFNLKEIKTANLVKALFKFSDVYKTPFYPKLTRFQNSLFYNGRQNSGQLLCCNKQQTFSIANLDLFSPFYNLKNRQPLFVCIAKMMLTR